ncbi:MAG: oxygen-dependent coproporphyrinogen oxidase [Planctomycetes bacterium]|nr:oxygen-dependent coproporphyrinogen oxidase [Planctomycetota bacterium]
MSDLLKARTRIQPQRLIASDTMRKTMENTVRAAQDAICEALAALDGQEFREDAWQRDAGGGGRTRVLQDGGFFEKAGVATSTVHGVLPEEAAHSARGRGVVLPDGALQFFATGVSLVLHPHNPHAPTAHANYRYFEIEGKDGVKPVWWFGGGADLTPCYLREEDARHFHTVLKAACDRHDAAFYPRFKTWCDEYFFIPHRGETRGLGGIFFDNLNDRPAPDLHAFVKDAAHSFIPAILPIYERRRDEYHDEHQKRWQGLRRGRYVEFNLVYDRGTTFGLRTGGRTESILMSLPLQARWEYDHVVDEASDEARLVEVLRSPRDWA